MCRKFASLLTTLTLTLQKCFHGLYLAHWTYSHLCIPHTLSCPVSSHPPPPWCLIPHVVWLCSMNLKPLHFALRHVFLSLHIRSLLHVSMLQSTRQDDIVVRCPRLQQLRPHKDDAVVRCPRLQQLRPHIRMTQWLGVLDFNNFDHSRVHSCNET